MSQEEIEKLRSHVSKIFDRIDDLKTSDLKLLEKIAEMKGEVGILKEGLQKNVTQDILDRQALKEEIHKSVVEAAGKKASKEAFWTLFKVGGPGVTILYTIAEYLTGG